MYEQMPDMDNCTKLQLISAQLRCPITHLPMRDPVVIQSGHTFQRQAIEGWFKRGNSTNPLTNIPVKTHEVYPNIAILNVIQNLPILQQNLRQQTKNMEQLLTAIEEAWNKETPTGVSQIKKQKQILRVENEDLKEFMKKNEKECKNKIFTQEIELLQKQQKNYKQELEIKTLRNVLLSLKQQLEESKRQCRFLNQKLQQKNIQQKNNINEHKRTASRSSKVSAGVSPSKEGYHLDLFKINKSKSKNLTQYETRNASKNSRLNSKDKNNERSARNNPESRRPSNHKLDKKRQTVHPHSIFTNNILKPIAEKPQGSTQQLIKKQEQKRSVTQAGNISNPNYKKLYKP